MLDYAIDLTGSCIWERTSESRQVALEERGDIEQGACLLRIERSLSPTTQGGAPLVWDNQVFHIADGNGMPGEIIKFENETELHGYWWEVVVSGLDIQYWFSGKDFNNVKHKLPRDAVVLRHLQKRALNSHFPVVSKSEQSYRPVA